METRSNFYSSVVLFFNVSLLVLYALISTKETIIREVFILDRNVIYFYSIFLYIYLIAIVLVDSTFHDGYKFSDIIYVLLFCFAFIFPSLLLPKFYYIDNRTKFIQFLFWFSIVSWTISTYFIFKRDKIEGDRTNFLTLISLFWLFLGFYTTIGSEVYNFSIKPINELIVLNKFSDIRIISGLLVLIFILCKAIINSFNYIMPKIGDIKRVQIPNNYNNVFAYFLRPVILICNILLSFFVLIANILWKIVAFISMCSAILFYSILLEISKQYIRFIYIKVILILIFIYLCLLLGDNIEKANVLFQEYLENDGFDTKMDTIILVIQSSFIVLSLLLFKAFIYMIVIFDANNYSVYEFLEECKKCFAKTLQILTPKIVYLLTSIWVSGLVLWGFSNIKLLNIEHFKQIGFYTLIMSCFITAVGVIFSISFLFKKTST